MYIHTFGCYFGLALSWVLFIGNKDTNPFGHPHNYTTYNSDTFAMIGVLLSPAKPHINQVPSSCGCFGQVSTQPLLTVPLNSEV